MWLLIKIFDNDKKTDIYNIIVMFVVCRYNFDKIVM